MVAVGGVNLETAEANETWRHAAHHGTGLGRRVAVVQDISHDRFAGGHQRQGSGGGHAEVVHRFAAKEFSYGGAQHGFAVSGARIGRQAGAFELQFEEAAFGLDFAQRDGSTVAELAGPVAELVAAVALGVGLHAGDGGPSTKHRTGIVRPVKPQRFSHFIRPQGEAGLGGGRWTDLRPAFAGDLARTTSLHLIAGRLAQEAGVPGQGLQRWVAHNHRHSGDLFNIMGINEFI